MEMFGEVPRKLPGDAVLAPMRADRFQRNVVNGRGPYNGSMQLFVA
jgi:hypothetical protein